MGHLQGSRLKNAKQCVKHEILLDYASMEWIVFFPKIPQELN